MKILDLSDIPERSSYVALRGTVNKEIHNKGVGFRIYMERAKYMESQGYFYCYGFIANPIIINVFKKVGGEVIKEVNLQKKETTIIAYIYVVDTRKMFGSKNQGNL